MAELAVNVDHVATVRQARGVTYPDPVAAAVIVELAGAAGVVVHLRGDRRHIQDRDLELIRKIVQSRMILEMAPTEEMMGIALGILPHQVTLVPERPDEVTTEGGLDLLRSRESVAAALHALSARKIHTSIFVDPDPRQIRMAKTVGAEVVEIHTGAFCEAKAQEARSASLARIVEAARLAHDLGLVVHAGHGIDYTTVKAFKAVAEISEFSIGHSIVARAIFVGLDRAVREMIALVKDL